MRIFSLLLFFVLAFAAGVPAHAEEQDVAATVRGVVRVVLVATDGQDAYFMGHGSGFAVASDKVLTNAHVVEMLRDRSNLVLGIVPSQGKRSYGGKVIAYSPGNDLALIQMSEGALPVSTFFAGAVTDGQSVIAIGYPGAVDRAQGLDINDMIQPLSPVKSSGNVSTGRSSHQFDTILHTAPMAAGNSGGPLVDACGRVLGVNSFGSLSDGSDAQFGFAVSNREVASFLRQAGISFQRTAAPCRSIAELDAQEAAKAQQDQAARAAQSQTEATAREKQLLFARNKAEHDIITARENALALAALMLAVAILSLGAGGYFHTQGNKRPALWGCTIGAALLIGAILTFMTRPSFSDIENQVASLAPPAPPPTAKLTPVARTYDAQGDNLCRIDQSRSRITVSQTDDIPLHWAEGGCVNGSTQYGRDGEGWSRIFVPKNDPAIAINSFDPASGTFRTERFLADADTLDEARSLRNRFQFAGCTKDDSTLSALQQMQSQIRAVLPAQANERLIYTCTKPKVAAN
jgi:S1-C subfamily serine protease